MHVKAIVEASYLCVHKVWRASIAMKWEYSSLSGPWQHNYSPIDAFMLSEPCVLVFFVSPNVMVLASALPNYIYIYMLYM